MAEKYEIDLELKSNFDKVVKDVNDLKKGMQNVQKETEDIGKSAKNAEKGVKSIGEGFKAVGLSLKAMGIGLLLEAFAILKDVFSKNQVVADKFATALGALSKVFNDLVNFLIKNIPDVVNFFKDIFENPQKHIEKLGTLIKENLIERFDSLLKTAGYLGEALGKLFEGKFAAAVESVKKAGKESVDIFTGVNNSVDRAGKAVEDIGNAISKYGKETWNAAAANVALQNAALIAAAQQAKLVEQYDRAAESLRQVRDNDLLSIEDRITANNKLKDVLDKQEKAMISAANLQLQAAQNTYENNKSIENQVALINAQANKEGVLAQIKGLKSEQLANEVSLTKELVAMKQSDIDATAQLALENKKFNASLKDDNIGRLSAEKEILIAEQETEIQRLQLKIDSAAQGTQARVDAEIEYKTRMQEIGNEIKQNEKDTADEEIAQAQRVADAKKAIQESTFSVLEGGIGLLKGLFEENKDIQKALLIAESATGIARIITNTSAANAADTFSASMMGPIAGPPYLATKLVLNKVGAGIGIAANLLATSKALSALGGGSAGGGSAPSGQAGGGGAAPNFNVVGATGVNQLAGAISNREQQPIMTYVTANNVTTAQGLDRNIIRSATLG
jgi:hypothetical protein